MDEQEKKKEEEEGKREEEDGEAEKEEDCRSLGTIAVDISTKHTCWGTFASIHAGGGK